MSDLFVIINGKDMCLELPKSVKTVEDIGDYLHRKNIVPKDEEISIFGNGGFKAKKTLSIERLKEQTRIAILTIKKGK